MWAVRGLLSQLVAAVERIEPDAIVVGFDDPVASVRRDRWPHYKATRTDKLATLVEQLHLAADVLRRLGIVVVVPAGLEADDVLASAARFAPTIDASTVIMTSDRDAFALIDEHTRVLRIISGGVAASPLLTPALLQLMLGIRPDQYCDFAALRGDPSDNLAGVRGIGPKTATKLLTHLGTARAAFDDLAAGGGRVAAAMGAGLARKLADPAARAAWEHNCQVMRMREDVPLGLDPDSGVGALPLPADPVRAVFESQHLTFTIPAALRLLARQEPDPVAPPRRIWSSPVQDRPTYLGHPPRRQQFGRLPAPAPDPSSAQLALFD
jgi:DNA polymerase-1